MENTGREHKMRKNSEKIEVTITGVDAKLFSNKLKKLGSDEFRIKNLA